MHHCDQKYINIKICNIKDDSVDYKPRMPYDDLEEAEFNGDDDDWHAGAERQVMNKMERWREKYGYKGRGEVMDDSSEMSENDILNIVEAKERDLILAAELGKALLEKNEELRK